ncbi:ABC transporter substrate-binding protein [Methylovirgula sp. 4M-Z18]|uniref:ABC transporter substrate-binding protein n=1 Tax=Methylovirgula sp. 4M-Z18 TaxID=2293567 RepID=UPI000E2E8D68|nr:ABC transporter substrate-binding protein [Methylovirgula sp. 4M-Z18]RFB78076.1 ABC transporter substrate-binding protein [Methylovirgula sp. 4M-Z18]
MRKILTGLMMAGALSIAGAAHAADTKTIAVSIPAADHGWTGGVVYHAQQEAKALEARYPGLKVIVKTSPDGASQANALEDLATQGIDALVALPHNSDELTDPIRQVKSKGVFITVVDRALREPIQDLYVAGNNPELGRVAAAYMKDKLSGKGDIVVIRGLPIVIDEQRVNAFNDGIKGTDIKVIDSQFGNWSRDDAFKVMQDFLTKHPKIDAVWCQDDDMAVGVLEAIKQANRTDIKFVVGGAGMKDMVKKVMDGDNMIPVDVLYPPAMVAVAMDLTAAGLYDKVPVRGSYILNATLVTKENAKNFYYPDSPF